jgi:hypothetical protein
MRRAYSICFYTIILLYQCALSVKYAAIKSGQSSSYYFIDVNRCSTETGQENSEKQLTALELEMMTTAILENPIDNISTATQTKAVNHKPNRTASLDERKEEMWRLMGPNKE